MSVTRFALSLIATACLVAPPAKAGIFMAQLDPLSGSGVTGNVQLTVDEVGGTIRVQYQASGLTPLLLHPGHIHGLFVGGPQTSGDPPPAADSFSPTLANDTDGDGFIEVAEGLPRYGNILMPLTILPNVANDGGFAFPVADALGNLNYDVTFNLNEPNNFEDPMNPGLLLDRGDIFPLDFREVVLHGRMVLPGPGTGTLGEVDGTNGYLPTLPVASGVIVAVPEPSSATLLAGLGSAFIMLRFRQKRAACS